MPNPETHLRLGQIYRAHGVRGQCMFYSYSGTADHLLMKRTYILQSAEGQIEKTRIKRILPYKNLFLIHFDLFSTPEEIQPWRKAILWIEKKKLQRSDSEMYDYEWEGFALLDENEKHVGVIVKIAYTPLQQFVVRLANEQEVLIPFVQEWIISLDAEKKSVVMRLPEGLF